MAAEHDPIDISDRPELLRLVEEMEASGKPCVLQRDGKDVAVLRPALAFDEREPRPMSEGSPLWRIVGASRSEGPTDVSADKHKYLAEAYADLHDKDSE